MHIYIYTIYIRIYIYIYIYIRKRKGRKIKPCSKSQFLSTALEKKTQEKHELSYFFHFGGIYDIETSRLICSGNQWTDFYMRRASVMKGLIVCIVFVSLWLKL